jgi:hypothetical protein
MTNVWTKLIVAPCPLVDVLLAPGCATISFSSSRPDIGNQTYSSFLGYRRPSGSYCRIYFGVSSSLLLSTSSRAALAPTQPPIQREGWSLSPGVKLSGREAGHSLPTSADVKNTWIYTSTPPYVFMT